MDSGFCSSENDSWFHFFVETTVKFIVGPMHIWFAFLCRWLTLHTWKISHPIKFLAFRNSDEKTIKFKSDDMEVMHDKHIISISNWTIVFTSQPAGQLSCFNFQPFDLLHLQHVDS